MDADTICDFRRWAFLTQSNCYNFLIPALFQGGNVALSKSIFLWFLDSLTTFFNSSSNHFLKSAFSEKTTEAYNIKELLQNTWPNTSITSMLHTASNLKTEPRLWDITPLSSQNEVQQG